MDDALRSADVDRLGEAMRQRDLTDEEVDLYNQYRESFLSALGSVLAALQEAGAPPATERQKTIWSTVAKLRRSTARLSQVQDIAGCRVVVLLMNDQDELVERLVHAHPDWRLYDRRARPTHGYRAVHLVAEIGARHVEVQVRTELQHLWAEVSEAFDRVVPGVKYGIGPDWVLGFLARTSSIAARVEAIEGTTPRAELEGFREELRAVLRDVLGGMAPDVGHSEAR